MGRYTGFLGLVVILAFAWLCSSHKRSIRLRTVAWGLGLQFAFALLVLKTPFSQVLRAISIGRRRAVRLRQRRQRLRLREAGR